MTTPRVKVKIEVDAPCSMRLTAADRKRIADELWNITYKSLLNQITIDVGEDLEYLDFNTPKVTVTQTKKRRKAR